MAHRNITWHPGIGEEDFAGWCYVYVTYFRTVP